MSSCLRDVSIAVLFKVMGCCDLHQRSCVEGIHHCLDLRHDVLGEMSPQIQRVDHGAPEPLGGQRADVVEGREDVLS